MNLKSGRRNKIKAAVLSTLNELRDSKEEDYKLESKLSDLNCLQDSLGIIMFFTAIENNIKLQLDEDFLVDLESIEGFESIETIDHLISFVEVLVDGKS